MRTSIEDLNLYAFCPRYYEQKGKPFYAGGSLHNNMKSLLIYASRKELETGDRVSFSQLTDRWARLFFNDREHTSGAEKEYIRTVRALHDFYGWFSELPLSSVPIINYPVEAPIAGNHILTGTIPVIRFNAEDGVSLIFTEYIDSSQALLRSNAVRFLALSLKELDLDVVAIHNAAFTSPSKVSVFTIIPNDTFWASCRRDAIGILNSMHVKSTYSNNLSCPACPIETSCKPAD